MTTPIDRWGLVALALFWLAWLPAMEGLDQDTALQQKLRHLVPIDDAHRVDCASLAAQHPMVILALGQSNAANHGAPAAPAGLAPVPLITEGQCTMAVDPLAGATGAGGSIWWRLLNRLSAQTPHRLWVVSVLGVDATSLHDWTDPRSPLRSRLLQQLAFMQAVGLPPQWVLWQHGEADAQLGTSSQAYAEGLDQLAATLAQAGSSAPILLARSTVCRSVPNGSIRSAVQSRAKDNPRFQLGPDTDTLLGNTLRSDGCHFSESGLDRAAQLWQESITSVHSIRNEVP